MLFTYTCWCVEALSLPEILRDKTMNDMIMYIPNYGKQNFPTWRSKLFDTPYHTEYSK